MDGFLDDLQLYMYVFGHQKQAGQMLKLKETTDILEMLRELKSVLVVNSVPNKKMQKLVRNLRVRYLYSSLSYQTPAGTIFIQ